MTITFFSDQYNLIKDIIFELRSLTFGQLADIKPQKTFSLLYEGAKQDCLLNSQLSRRDIENKEELLQNAHLFVHTNTLFGYFIELRAFMESILSMIKLLCADKGQMVQNAVSKMENVIQIFEYAYKNRFGQSYLVNEITDYNIEFNGGIQQLISAYDGAYKSQTALLGERIGRS